MRLALLALVLAGCASAPELADKKPPPPDMTAPVPPHPWPPPPKRPCRPGSCREAAVGGIPTAAR